MAGDASRETKEPIRLVMIGCGGMARHHVRRILQQKDTTEIRLVCEPSSHAYGLLRELYEEEGLEPPPNIPELDGLLAGHADRLDAAFIVTPHALHHDQAKACLEAGLDVLLEKPMVMNEAQAHSLIEARDRSGRSLVVAFNGSLSPQIRCAVDMLRSGELGKMLTVSGVVWQSWKQGTDNTWRQVPEIAGGGFLFDTGAHMLNTLADLAGEEFAEVAAWLDNRGAPVDISGTVMAKLESGVLVTIHACGETVKSCASDVRVFCSEAILRTGVWGERLEIQRQGSDELVPVPVDASLGTWEQFTRVVRGEIENPSPPEIGLRMARLWDAIRASAARGGLPVEVGRISV
jgi:predicted dehydrogenase